MQGRIYVVCGSGLYLAMGALERFEGLLGLLKEQLDTIPVHLQFIGLAVVLLFVQIIVSLLACPPPNLPIKEYSQPVLRPSFF